MGKINLTDVTKNFGTLSIIRPFNLEISEGEFVVFVGPSGCGKSTLLRMIAGLENCTSGSIAIDDTDVTQLPSSKRRLAMVFQSYALYPHMTVRKNIAFPLRMAKLPQQEIEKRTLDAAKVLNLSDYLDRRPGQLSGGQRQRVAIGRAIVREPTAFLFDEPLSNLDAALRVNMRLKILELHKSLKTTMIYVTHDQVEAMTMADRIVVLRGGVIEQIGSPLEIYNRPVNQFVAGFIGAPKMNFLTGGEFVERNKAQSLGVRPEHLKIVPHDADLAGTLVGTLVGTLGLVENLGADSYFHIKTQECDDLVVRASSAQVDLAYGATVHIAADSEKIYRFGQDGMTLNHI